jgi:hypothetical protein
LPEEVIQTLTNYGIKVNLLYNSFSDTPALRKFRVVIFINQVIDNATTAKFIQLNLMNIFEGTVDKACKDYARMFFGGKEILHLDNNLNDTVTLIDVLNTVVASQADVKKRKPEFFDYTSKCGKNPNVHIYMESCENPALLEGVNQEENNDGSTFNNGEMIREFNLEECIKEVRIFNDFISGE